MRAVVLITGGTGFLGRHLALALKGNYEVVICGRNNKQNKVAAETTGCRVLPVDVARVDSVRDVFVEVRPEVVIHAAAVKFVDKAEREPLECVDVNVLGSENVARVSLERGVKTVVGISTDKATPPIRNTYGLSKALMERMFCSLDRAGTRFLCVRYGNVAWSTGSVFPIWKRMHDVRGVIETTGPDMRRFFFTADEAVAQVLTAIAHADELRGAVLVRPMKAALMRDILDLWVRKRGGRWERTDGRPGERDDEFLIGELEIPFAEEINLDGAQYYAISFNRRAVRSPAVVLSSANAERLSENEIDSLIDRVPVEER